MSNIKVEPDNKGVDVATDVIDSVHYPVYKTAYGLIGEVTQVSSVNALPVTPGDDALERQIDDISISHQILAQLKITNRHLSIISGTMIGEDDTHE